MPETPEIFTDVAVATPTSTPRPVRARAPRTVTLTREQSIKLLARNHVGRLAYTFRDAVDIVPINYVCANGWIYARTAPGQKVAKLRHHRWVAFEVDELYGSFDWSSVVVHGALYLLSPQGTDTDAWEAAVAAIQQRFPDAFTTRDPVPQRTIVFRIHVDEVSGRRMTPPTR